MDYFNFNYFLIFTVIAAGENIHILLSPGQNSKNALLKLLIFNQLSNGKPNQTLYLYQKSYIHGLFHNHKKE